MIDKIERAITNYFYAEDMHEEFKDRPILRGLSKLICSAIPNALSLGAIYLFRNDPESLTASVGAIEAGRVWTKYTIRD